MLMAAIDRADLLYLFDLDLFAWNPKSEWMGKFGRKEKSMPQSGFRIQVRLRREE